MAVVTFLSPKGGTGKTTAAVLFACEMAHRGQSVVLVDADPNKPIKYWSSLGTPPPAGVRVVHEDEAIRAPDADARRISERNIVSVLGRHNDEADWLVVDLEGSAHACAVTAVAVSHTVIVPSQTGTFDAVQAVRAVETVRATAEKQRRFISQGILLTRTQTIQSRVDKDVAGALDDYPVLPVTLAQRVAYRAIMTHGGDIRSLPAGEGGNLDKAIENVVAVSDAIVDLTRTSLAKAA